MEEKVFETIELPQGFKASIEKNVLNISGNNKEISKSFSFSTAKAEVKDDKIVVYQLDKRKKSKAEAGSIASHIKNMIKGIEKGFTYKLEIVYSHFPLNVSVKNGFVEINNLGGAKHPKKAKIVGNTKVEVKGKEIIVSGNNKEDVGQTAANMEVVTRIKGKDKRVFQDGIYIVSRE
ncbi:MAG: 50S ribosomal protein L6 [Candidatus Diapherotrites archaeon]